MIRPARFGDIPRLRELFVEMHARSKYAALSGLDAGAVQSLLMQCVRGHGGSHAGSTLFNVSEVDGVVQGFMVGMLDRVYYVGTMLQASDTLLYMTKDAPKHDMMALIDAYLIWAETNPKVIVTHLSWTDAITDSARMEMLYKRKGFRRSGGI